MQDSLYGPREYWHPPIKDVGKSGPFFYVNQATPENCHHFKHHSGHKFEKRVAILLDGGFYRWRAHTLFGDKTDQYRWSTEFISLLKQKRKVALRLGKLSIHTPYILPHSKIKKLCNGSLEWKDITEDDLKLNIEQKGVDMRIGVDIASLAFKQQVDQIILISGDSDFVPAAKLARREGIDFIVDHMGANIADDLFEHIDGLQTRIKKFMPKNQDSDEDDPELE